MKKIEQDYMKINHAMKRYNRPAKACKQVGYTKYLVKSLPTEQFAAELKLAQKAEYKFSKTYRVAILYRVREEKRNVEKNKELVHKETKQ